jgi:uncharacterized membrane protein
MMYALRYSSGPLPAPEVLEHYDRIIPGGAGRIVGWVENQAGHRQSLETKRVLADISHESRGQIFAFILTLLTLGCSTFLIHEGRDVSGLAMILGELSILAGIFVYNRISQVRELRGKLRELLTGESQGEKARHDH